MRVWNRYKETVYSLVNGLIGLTTQSPLPDNRINDELAEEFVTFLCLKSVKDMMT